MLKEKEQNLSFGIITLIIVLFLTIGYSAFERNLLIDDITLTVRPVKDIRVTGTWQKESTNGAESSSVDYNVKSSLLSFDLPKESSTITYTIQVTNIGNVDMGILKITGLPANLEYELTNYTLKEKICTEERCNRGIQKEFQITIKYKNGGYNSSNTTYDIKLDYDFQRVWNIKYDGFDEEEIMDMPTEVLNSDTLILQFDESIINEISVKMNDEDFQDYKVEKGTITIENVTGNITILKEVILSTDFVYDKNNLEQTYVVPITGYYKLEVWGAQGGNSNGGIGGKGGYSVGVAYLTSGTTLYVNLGGQGTAARGSTSVVGGYNGGGNGYANDGRSSGGSGGGATHIATTSGVLSELSEKKDSILIVAGGGGGSSGFNGSCSIFSPGGVGGGISGGYGASVRCSKSKGSVTESRGGTQSSGGSGGKGGEATGSAGSFGKGGNSGNRVFGGGGGGYYGGGGAGNDQYIFSSGGGGSGNIDNVMSYKDIVAETIAGNLPFPNFDGTANETGHAGNGAARITFVEEKSAKEEQFQTKKIFYYKNGEQTYEIKKSGYYKLEVWGAQGGSSVNASGGKGGYSVGVVYLAEGTKLYIHVGGHGAPGNALGTTVLKGGYNGGGAGYSNDGHSYGGSGGGATHVATTSGLLSELSEKKDSILIVAGGGGGATGYISTHNLHATGGFGGGITGGPGVMVTCEGSKGNATQSGGGTQTSGGAAGKGDEATGSAGSFGQGGNSGNRIYGGGGGGYYGGGGAGNAMYKFSPGAGGSGNINGVMSYKDIVAETIGGNLYFPNVEGVASENGHSGHGAVKITFLEEKAADDEFHTEENFYFEKVEQVYKIKKTGYYKLEVWGAQGGNSISASGGKGGYSVGAVYLTEGTTLYIHVGEKGASATGKTSIAGGYNGGGNGYASDERSSGGSGGGATHIATASGILSKLNEKKDSILIVAGGGGGAVGFDGSDKSHGQGGAGGGLSGGDGLRISGAHSSGSLTLSKGGTQTSGGIGGSGDEATGASGTFGQGGNSGNRVFGGGGGGYYGGGGAGNSMYLFSTSSGGSGYIGGVTNYGDVVANTIIGTKAFSTIDGKGTETGHAGHGHAKITFIE